MLLGIGEVAVGHRHMPAALGREVVQPAGGPAHRAIAFAGTDHLQSATLDFTPQGVFRA